MKTYLLTAMAAAMIVACGASFASGAKPSSFVPRGPEPHSTLADVHGRKSLHKISHQKAAAVHKRTAAHAKPN
jgi:hypothetical protein